MKQKLQKKLIKEIEY